MPPPHAAATIALTVIMFVLFAQGRIRIEIVCLILISLLALGFYFFPIDEENGRTGIEIAFGGFGHEVLITICSLMILGRGLVVTGALEPATRLLARLWSYNRGLGLLCTIVTCGVMSMFINDTPVLVLVMPILLTLAARTGSPASQTLMPVNFAILIGGMATTIGTSTNLLVVSIAADLGVPHIGIFDFVDIAFVAALVAIPYLWLVMPRLLPSHRQPVESSPRRFFASLHVDNASAIVGMSLDELRAKTGNEVEIHGVTRDRQHFRRRDMVVRLNPGDIVHIEGTLHELQQASERTKAPLAHPSVERAIRFSPTEDHVIAEVVIGSESTLVGATPRSAQIGDRYGAAVIGLYRPERALFQTALDTASERLEVGDVLLMRGAPERLKKLQISEGAMILEGAAEVPRSLLAPAALIIVAAVVMTAALRIVPISIAALTGTIAMIVTGCVKFDRLGRALSAEVIVLVAASIALGQALLVSGAADWLGAGLSVALAPLPPALAIAAIMAFAALITNFSSNTAAAAVTTPIAIAIAANLGIPPTPMVLAVLFGANLCYATPVAYQTNVLIMSAGGYRFSDYVRAGLPLVFIMIIVLSVLLVIKYQL